ncbi:uncharacterized protein LOC100842956 isoform X3 [Brachypodium distachyon]|uniref:uncharacterized protein LOC100842956 isoform X3 n=1 Tax=Brachypodium distachyon TaxID=15368 RepID=UPI000D0DD92F|nr:uncharacterized protein LOC100842956 isoform X3 [Brachypodium distachyon]|eukprot:XP_024314754.1 uncharacterized protein LOC100842956 isoform X3 [Brachypodium distachyon]
MHHPDRLPSPFHRNKNLYCYLTCSCVRGGSYVVPTSQKLRLYATVRTPICFFSFVFSCLAQPAAHAPPLLLPCAPLPPPTCLSSRSSSARTATAPISLCQRCLLLLLAHTRPDPPPPPRTRPALIHLLLARGRGARGGGRDARRGCRPPGRDPPPPHCAAAVGEPSSAAPRPRDATCSPPSQRIECPMPPAEARVLETSAMTASKWEASILCGKSLKSLLLDIGIERATGIVWSITGGNDITLVEPELLIQRHPCGEDEYVKSVAELIEKELSIFTNSEEVMSYGNLRRVQMLWFDTEQKKEVSFPLKMRDTRACITK